MGATYVAGRTNSAAFPTKNAFQAANAGGAYDAVISKISADGSSLSYSSYAGGSGDDEAYGIALSQGGSACVIGFSDSSNYPTLAGAFDTTPNGGADVLLTCFNPTGTAVYSSYLGSSGAEYGMSVAILSSGFAAVTGVTTGTGFPSTAGAYDVTQNSPGANDGFVSVLDVGLTITSGVESEVTPSLRVGSPYPNPFGAHSAIRVSLDRDSWLAVRVFDLQGRLIRTGTAGAALAGFHQFPWDGRDDGGRRVATGVYLFQVSAPGFHATRSALLIK